MPKIKNDRKYFMNFLRIVTIVFAVVLLALMAPGQTQQRDDSQAGCFDLSLKPIKTVVRAGDTIMVHSIITNVSDNSCWLLEVRPVEVQVTVTDENGRQMAKQGWYQKMIDSGAIEAVAGNIDAKQKVESDSDITNMFKISRPGRYSINFERKIFYNKNEDPLKSYYVLSKTVQVAVTR